MKTILQKLVDNLEVKRDMWGTTRLADRQMRGAYTDALVMAKALLGEEENLLNEKYQEGYRDALQYGEDEAKYFGH